MLRPCDFLVFGDISTFGLNRESMTRNIPLILRPSINANTILSTTNAIQLACLYSFLQPNNSNEVFQTAITGRTLCEPPQDVISRHDTSQDCAG